MFLFLSLEWCEQNLLVLQTEDWDRTVAHTVFPWRHIFVLWLQKTPKSDSGVSLSSTVVEGASGARKVGFESWLCYLLSLCLEAKYLTSLCLNFLVWTNEANDTAYVFANTTVLIQRFYLDLIGAFRSLAAMSSHNSHKGEQVQEFGSNLHQVQIQSWWLPSTGTSRIFPAAR